MSCGGFCKADRRRGETTRSRGSNHAPTSSLRSIKNGKKDKTDKSNKEDGSHPLGSDGFEKSRPSSLASWRACYPRLTTPRGLQTTVVWSKACLGDNECLLFTVRAFNDPAFEQPGVCCESRSIKPRSGWYV